MPKGNEVRQMDDPRRMVRWETLENGVWTPDQRICADEVSAQELVMRLNTGRQVRNAGLWMRYQRANVVDWFCYC